MSGFFIESLDTRHNRKDFDCGEPELNIYLQRFARQNARNGSSRTYVAVQPDETRICGYFTLSAGTVALTDFPHDVRKGWPRLVPSVHLGRLTVAQEFQGQRLGHALISSVFEIATQASDLIGIAVLELWALNENSRRFYGQFEFTQLLDDAFHLYLPVETGRASLSE